MPGCAGVVPGWEAAAGAGAMGAVPAVDGPGVVPGVVAGVVMACAVVGVNAGTMPAMGAGENGTMPAGAGALPSGSLASPLPSSRFQCCVLHVTTEELLRPAWVGGTHVTLPSSTSPLCTTASSFGRPSICAHADGDARVAE